MCTYIYIIFVCIGRLKSHAQHHKLTHRIKLLGMITVGLDSHLNVAIRRSVKHVQHRQHV